MLSLCRATVSLTREALQVGYLADSVYDTCGSYFNAGANVVTVKAAMEAAGLQMTYSIGSYFNAYPSTVANTSTAAIPAAVAAAQSADVVVAVLGDSQSTCGEMVDRADLDLPGAQLPLLQALTATGKPVVVLLIHGRPMTFGRNNVGLNGVSALMTGWRPGEEGGPAFLNVLSGAVSPSGRLTQAWPRSVGGIGGPGAPYLYPFQGNHMGEAYSAGDGPSSSLFGFGEGLSYSAFDLHSLSITPNRTTATGTFSLALTATNTGDVDSAVPIQVFFRDPVCYPVRISSIQLVRFTKIFLKAGESKNVTIDLAARDLAYWDDGRNGNDAVGPEGGWVVDPGVFNLVIGTAGFTSWQQPQGLLGNVEVVSAAAAAAVVPAATPLSEEEREGDSPAVGGDGAPPCAVGAPCPDNMAECQPAAAQPNVPQFHMMDNSTTLRGGTFAVESLNDVNAIFEHDGIYHVMNQVRNITHFCLFQPPTGWRN